MEDPHMEEKAEQGMGQPELPGQRYARQGILDIRRLRETKACVIGCGAGGRVVGRLLAQMGVGNIALYDPDTIEEVNLAPQGWDEESVGTEKVFALANELRMLNSTLSVQTFNCYFPPHHLERYDVRFCCVDTIESRNVLFSHMPHKGLLVDGRSAGECLEVYGVDLSSETSREAYSKTLFAQEEAYQGACTTVSMNYTASIAAGLEIHQFTRWIRNIPLQHIKFNILSGEQESKVIL